MDEFWDSTLLELNDIAESKVRMTRAEQKEQINYIFVLAEAITTRISYFFSDPKERTEDMIANPWDFYPDLFEDHKKEAEMRKEKTDQEIQRQKVIDWANHINAKRHRKEGTE